MATGGAGYIGSHVCKALAGASFTPISYDNLVNGNRWAVKWGPSEEGDIGDRERLLAVLVKYRSRAVMHFAAHAYVGESIHDPGKYYRNNVAGTLTLLEAMKDHDIDRLIFSSACATYGLPDTLPITEDHPQRPINPYGFSKLVVEKMLRDFSLAHGLHYISLRYFNAAGADLDNEIGESHDPETHLIPRVLAAAYGLTLVITVFGSDYNTIDGTCIRDYIHVSDLADAHILALQRLLGGSVSCAYNLGNGKGFSVREVIAKVERATRRRVPVNWGPRRVGDPAALVGDASRAKSELLWRPTSYEISTIIKTAVRWHSKMWNHGYR